MGLQLPNLDGRTRELMIEELEADVAAGRLWLNPRLSSKGEADFPGLLRQAMAERDEVWLGEALRTHGRVSSTEFRRGPTGARTMVRVPATAAITIAEEEFARYYARAVCRRAIEEGIPRVVIYRAKAGPTPGQEAQSEIDAQWSLDALRARREGDQTLRLPPGPNAELNVRLP
ncbi:MAG TPA: hypothetical protein VHS28_08515 [Chloroflexota bacterium]|nr:hypothetical protein [Chloroflexota bacterium]